MSLLPMIVAVALLSALVIGYDRLAAGRLNAHAVAEPAIPPR